MSTLTTKSLRGQGGVMTDIKTDELTAEMVALSDLIIDAFLQNRSRSVVQVSNPHTYGKSR